MTIRLSLLISTFFLHTLVLAETLSAKEISQPDLRIELLRMRDRDQALRRMGQIDAEKALVVSREHVVKLRQLVQRYGWPTIPMVGEDGAQAAWLIAQHADDDPDFQREALNMIKPLADSGLVSRRHYAYLWDRLHDPQMFGTQGTCQGANNWIPRSIENPGGVDARRAKVGLGSLAEYRADISSSCR